MTVDYRDYGIHGMTVIAGQNAPAASIVNLYDAAVPSQSYIAIVSALCQAAPTAPFYKISLIWKDAQGGNVIRVLHFFPLATNVAPASSNMRISGRGPVNGPWLTVLCTNYDTAAMAVDFEFIESSTVVTRHDWENDSNNISGTYTYAGKTFSTPVSDCAQLNLASSPGIAIAAGGSQVRVSGMFAGYQQLEFGQPVVFAASVVLFSVNPDFASPLTTLFAGAVPASGNLLLQGFAAPRGPILVEMDNTSGGVGSIAYAVTAVEQAS